MHTSTLILMIKEKRLNDLQLGDLWYFLYHVRNTCVNFIYVMIMQGGKKLTIIIIIRTIRGGQVSPTHLMISCCYGCDNTNENDFSAPSNGK